MRKSRRSVVHPLEGGRRPDPRSLVQTEWQTEKRWLARSCWSTTTTSNIVKILTQFSDHHTAIISTQHVHLDHHNCLEIIAVRGQPSEIHTLLNRLKAIKGLKHVSLAAGTTGERLV